MRVIDSHTEGEPTRLIVAGGPDLGSGPLRERRRIFAERHDGFRTFALNEPRGFDAMVGALLCEPQRPDLRGGTDLLQQRRLSRHVRPWHDRRGGHARAYGTAPRRHGIASRRRSGS